VASLQAKHERGCSAGRAWTRFATALDDCTCKQGPLYYVVVRSGKAASKTPVGRNRREAERALRKIGVAVDDGHYQPQRNIAFTEWADTWIATLERKPSTRHSYASTIGYSKLQFGSRRVRDIRVNDVVALAARLRDAGLADSTRAKHLRVLHACFEGAVAHDYAAQNPVRALPIAQRPRPAHKEAAYFENHEISVLFRLLPDGLVRTVCELALKTGIRQGEALAIQWGDVDLGTATLRIRRSITGRYVGRPKNHERRDVDLTADVVELLGRWWGAVGRPADPTAWIFAGDSGSPVSPRPIVRSLYLAMQAAGIPRIGPTGERRTFHSLRHTYAKRALEVGAELLWLSRALGHSSIMVTASIYGHFETLERKKQVAKLEGAFQV
jgi:integrase